MKKYDNITYDVLYKAVSSYIDNEEELKIITKAYKYAYEKHFGQKRRTGEDYIIHPLNVALILTEIYADYECLCAALLHDVLEDCGVPKEEMVKEGAVVIDVGTTRVPDATKKSGFKLTGDVKFDEVAPKCSFITPVPGGVGPMTIVSLMKNTLLAGKKAIYQ